MKRPEYVAAAVTACRKALAGEPVDLETLQSVFSRSGFTDGYFEGRLGAEMFGIRQKEDVTAAAGVLGGLETLYTDPRKQVQKVEADFRFTMKAGEPARLVVTDGDGNISEAAGEIPQAAVNRPTDPERAAASLSKTGGTPYHVRSVSCEIGEGLMLPASAVNALRREALGKLDGCAEKPAPSPSTAQGRARRADTRPRRSRRCGCAPTARGSFRPNCSRGRSSSRCRCPSL